MFMLIRWLKIVYHMMCPHYQERKNTVSWLMITEALPHTLSPASSNNISVGNHGFFLLLSAPRTSPPRACLRLEATVSLQHASLPSQHRSPGGMALIQTQRPKLTCPMPQKWQSGRIKIGTRDLGSRDQGSFHYSLWTPLLVGRRGL